MSAERPATAEEIRALLEAHLASTSSTSSSSTSSTSSSSTSSTSSSPGKRARELARLSPAARERREGRARDKSAFVRSVEARGARGCRPRDFPRRSQAGVRSIFENRTGRQAQRFLARMPRKQRARVLHLAMHPGNGRVLPRELNHVWSRWVVACAWLLWSLRRKSKRHGMTDVVDGFSQGMFCTLFRMQDGQPCSISRLFATSYREGSEECGPMHALKRAGLWTWASPPIGQANPRFVGPPHVCSDGLTRRFAFAVYWLAALPD